MMREAAQSDIHLEADIRAAKDNRTASRRATGFQPSTSGSRLAKLDGDKATDQKVAGDADADGRQ